MIRPAEFIFGLPNALFGAFLSTPWTFYKQSNRIYSPSTGFFRTLSTTWHADTGKDIGLRKSLRETPQKNLAIEDYKRAGFKTVTYQRGMAYWKPGDAD